MPSIIRKVANTIKARANEINETRQADKEQKQKIQQKARTAYYQGYENESVKRARQRGRQAAAQPSGFTGMFGKVTTASKQLNSGFDMLNSDMGLDLPGISKTQRQSEPRAKKSKGTTIIIDGHTVHVGRRHKKKQHKKKPNYDPLGMF
ncbi:MAG TPA: hypothetical protein VLH35_05295 [Candidatus Acidoferrales bacterium]|nr:hypothetical protein [Candidatus Acidoferrales bacterium]